MLSENIKKLVEYGVRTVRENLYHQSSAGTLP